MFALNLGNLGIKCKTKPLLFTAVLSRDLGRAAQSQGLSVLLTLSGI